ncbi:hypothetical protein J6590_041717 [Homalodisca vitripennis]|nr:hypothetical protein J6590_041717 [Homalodisca vitripennis]
MVYYNCIRAEVCYHCQVIPDYWEQEWSDRYCGMFHFQFWRFGVWTDVVVDDLLPTVDNVLLTTQAGAPNEFWAALLEKAYAKLHGSYDALREGHLCDALVDFTGGVSEVVDLQAEEFSENEDKRATLLETLLQEVSDHSVMCFTVVVREHSYCSVFQLQSYSNELTLSWSNYRNTLLALLG